MKPTPAQTSWDSRVPDGLHVETGVPGALVELVEREDGLIEGLNGAGSVVAVIYPRGIEGYDYEDEWDG